MKKLYRSRSDQKISGLCGGLAIWSGIDATVLRLVAVAAALFSFGTVLIFYIIASVIVPKEPFGSFSDGHDFY
ncbi:DNA-binding transcriptional activator PspC [compost metagenome]